MMVGLRSDEQMLAHVILTWLRISLKFESLKRRGTEATVDYLKVHEVHTLPPRPRLRGESIRLYHLGNNNADGGVLLCHLSHLKSGVVLVAHWSLPERLEGPSEEGSPVIKG